MHARIEILGRVGREPQQRFGNDGNGFTTFSVVVNRKYKDRNGDLQEVAEWYDVIVGGRTGENIVKYVNKGDMIYLEGAVTARAYEKDGEPRASINVRAFAVEFIGGGGGNAGGERRSKGTGSGGVKKKKKKPTAQADFLADDGDDNEIPF